MSFAHSNSLSKELCALIYRIGKKKKLDLGTVIFNHIMSFTRSREYKVKLPFPSLIGKQLEKAQTDLVVVLLRMSLAEAEVDEELLDHGA